MRMINTLYIVSIFLALSLLSGCSSSPFVDHIQHQEDLAKERNTQVKKQLKEMPEWFLEAKYVDEQGVYAKATAFSEDLQSAIDKANLLAEYELAKNVGVLVSGQERLFQRTTGSGEVSSTNERVIDSFVNSVRISGYTTLSTEVFDEGKGFRVYRLLYMDYDRFEGLQSEAHAAYEELLRRVKSSSAEDEDKVGTVNKEGSPTDTNFQELADSTAGVF